MRYVNTKEKLKELYKYNRINAWQLRLLWGYLNFSLDNDTQRKKAERLINKLCDHEVIDLGMRFAMLNHEMVYHVESNIEVLTTGKVISARYFDPFFYMPA